MKKIYIVHYRNRFWNNYDVLIIQDEKLIERIPVNYSLEVTEDFILIYEATGGHDHITRGALIRKIYIGESELERVDIDNTYVLDGRKNVFGGRESEHVIPEKLKKYF